MAATVILLEARPRRASDGAVIVVRLAGGGHEFPYVYGGEHWRAGITGLPRSIASLDFDGEQLGGGGVAQALALQWAPPSQKALAEIAAHYWQDALVSVRIGPEGSLPPVVVAGLVADTAISDGMFRIAIADQLVDLKLPLLIDRYAGTGGVEGPAEFEGMIKPRAWGRCFNVAGRPIDTTNHIWVFGDPLRQWNAIDQVRDMGVAPDPSDVSVLGWQGSAAATFQALQAASAAEGGGVLAPSIACVKWWTQPDGDLHADIRGETQGGYVETAPEIVGRIVAANSTLTFAAGAIAAAVAVRPAACGWRVDGDTVTAAETISDLLGGVSLSWLLIGGQIAFRRWEWTASTRVVRSLEVTRNSTIKPLAARKLGYRRNWAPMARGDIGAVVFARDVVYDDSTSVAQAIDDAAGTAVWDKVIGRGKPVDFADVTAANIASGIAGQGPFSTIASVGYGSSLLTGFNVFATLASVAFGSSYLKTSTGTTATDALYQTGLGISSGFFGQGALATLNAADYATRVTGAGKPELYATRGDNLVPDPLMAEGAARYAGSGWTFTARANAGDPGQGYATFASGVGGLLGVNGLQNFALTVGADRRVHFSAMVYHDNTVAGYGAANLECFTASGVSMGNVSAPLIPKVAGQWTAVAAWVTVPAGTASVKAFFDRRTTNAGGATTGISVTAIRIATTELAATLGADIALNTFDGGALVARSALLTALGVASGFAGQGAFATVNSAAYGSALLTGFGALAPLASVAFGSSYLRTGTGAAATDALYQTSLGIASGISGQGSGATANNLAALNAAEGAKLVSISTGATRFTADRYLNRNSSFSDWVGDSPTGWDKVAYGYAGSATAVTTSTVRGGLSAQITNGTGRYGDAIPVQVGETLWIEYRFLTTANGSAGGPNWYLGGDGMNGTDNPVQAYYVANNAVVTTAMGAQVGLTKITITSGSTFRPMFIMLNSPGATGVVDYLAVSREQPGSTVGADVANNVFDSGTLIARTALITSLGQASAIAGQGAFATLSSAAYGSALLTGFGALAPLASVAFGSSYLKTSTGTAATDALYQTSLGIASGYSGQGPWGTYNATPPAKLEGIADGAGASLPGLVDTSSVYTIKGNSVVKNATGWTGTVFCPLPLIGAARVSFRAVFAAGVSSYNIGFAVDPTGGQTAGWAGSGIWGVGVSTDASANYYLVNANGQFSNTSTPYQTGDVVTLDYQGASIVISRTTAAGVTTTIGTWTVDLGARFYCKAKLYSSGDALKEILVSNQNDPADVARNVRDGAALLPRTALITSLGTASGIVGQGAFATKSQAVYGSDITGFPYPLNPANMTMADTALRLRADAMVYGNGAYVQNLQPMELGSNKTETRIASGFNGQGALATQNAADWTGGVTGKPLALASGIDPSGKIDSAYIGYGFSSTSVRLSDYWPAELGSNKTETRIASAVSGQGPFATQAGGVSLDNRTLFSMPSRLSGLSNGDPGALPGGNIIFEPGQGFGDYRYLSELRPEEARGNRTETRTATGIAGQGIWATAGQIGRTQTQGATSYFAANAFSLNYTITRSDGTSTLTEALAVTGIGIAAGFQGQAALATMNQVDTPQIAPGSVSGFQSVDLGIGSIGAGEAAISEQFVTYTTTGGRLRVEISADTERSGTGTNAASIQLSALRADGSEILIGRSVKCQAVVDGPPVYYVAYVTFPAGTYRFRLRLNVSSGKGSNTWSIPAGTLGVEETKR